jgi:prepilin-type N-terminal cleavage/methylation domain-containing protein
MKTSAPAAKTGGRGGFTLLEMSLALAVALSLAAALMSMLMQHFRFMEFCQQQRFLTEEAPQIGNLLVRLLNGADHCFVYATRDDALAGANPVLGSGQAAGLFFKAPAGDTQLRVLAIEALPDGRAALRCLTPLPGGGTTAWTVSNDIAAAEFRAEEGIVGVVLNGRNGEQVTYWGGAR